MQALTKKQLNAIQRVINRAEKRYYKDDKYSGQVVTKDGVVVSDGYVSLFYPEPQELKQNTRMPENAKENLFSKFHEFLEAKSYAVNEPFDMRLCDHPQTWLKNNLLEAPSVHCSNGLGIDLTARYGKWDDEYISGRFVNRDITDACEAVGKYAVCYLLKNGNGIPFMLVLPFVDGHIATDEVSAIVTPARTS